jgi:hypothetical protein
MRSLLLCMLFANTLAAQPRPEDANGPFTRFLFPILQGDVHGAFGSVWRAEAWFYYAGSEDASDGPTVIPLPFCRSSPSCFFVLHLEPVPMPFPVEPSNFQKGSALLLHVESRFASNFTFSSRVRDLSRAGDSAGTSIPVVREDGITAQPVHLLNVSIAPKFRNMLRIYALPEVADPEVEVRYYGMPDFDLQVDLNPVRTERVRLRTYPAVQGYLVQPAIAEVVGFDTAPEVTGKTALWIDVVPITPGLRIWAFVSVTNNDTQQVTLITPDGR